MPKATQDTVGRIKAEIRERIVELRPQVDEYRRLEKAMQALDGGSDASRKRGRPRKAR